MMKIYFIKHKHYATAWYSLIGYDSSSQTMTGYRTMKAARAALAALVREHGFVAEYYEIVAFVDTSKPVDARRRSTWEKARG